MGVQCPDYLNFSRSRVVRQFFFFFDFFGAFAWFATCSVPNGLVLAGESCSGTSTSN